jgi:hypothetical protein
MTPARRIEIVLVDFERPGLLVHFPHHIARRSELIGSEDILAAMLGIPKLGIRHIDVHDSTHQPDAMQAVLGAGVIDQWHAQTAADHARHAGRYPRDRPLYRLGAVNRHLSQHHGSVLICLES